GPYLLGGHLTCFLQCEFHTALHHFLKAAVRLSRQMSTWCAKWSGLPARCFRGGDCVAWRSLQDLALALVVVRDRTRKTRGTQRKHLWLLLEGSYGRPPGTVMTSQGRRE